MKRTVLLNRRVGSLLALIGCASPSGDVRAELCAVPGCTDGCRQLEVTACDVAEESCKEAVFQSLLCVRGGRLTQRPDTAVEDPDAFHEPEAPDMPATEPAQGYVTWLQAIDQAMQLLRLQAPGQTTTEAMAEGSQSLVGRFDPATSMVKIQQQSSGPDWVNMLVLAHEYTHALQQEEAGAAPQLAQFFASDGQFARYSSAVRQGIRAYVEGEAQLYGFLTYAFMRRVDVGSWAMSDYLRFSRKQLEAEVLAAKAPWAVAAQTLHYPVGFEFLWQSWQSGGQRGVRELAGKLPANFGLWLDGLPIAEELASSWDDGFACRAPRLPQDYEQIVQDSLGPSGVLAFIMPLLDASLGAPLEPAWQLARAVRGDWLRIYAQRNPEITPNLLTFPELVSAGNVALEWNLRFRDATSAASFADGVSYPELSVTRQGNAVAIAGSVAGAGSAWHLSSCD